MVIIDLYTCSSTHNNVILLVLFVSLSQLVDDVLDFTACAAHLGKPSAADLKLGLATGPVLFACQQVRRLQGPPGASALRGLRLQGPPPSGASALRGLRLQGPLPSGAFRGLRLQGPPPSG